MKRNCSKNAKTQAAKALIYEDLPAIFDIHKDDSKEGILHEIPTNFFELHENSQPKSSKQLLTDSGGAHITPSSSGSKRIDTLALNDSENVHPNQYFPAKANNAKCSNIKSNESCAKLDDFAIGSTHTHQDVSRKRIGLNSAGTALRDSGVNIGIRRSNRTRKFISIDQASNSMLDSDAAVSASTAIATATARSSDEASLGGETHEASGTELSKKAPTLATVVDLSQETKSKPRHSGNMDIRSFFASAGTSAITRASTSASTSTLQNAKQQSILPTEEADKSIESISSAQNAFVLDTSSLIMRLVRDGYVSEKDTKLQETSDEGLFSHSSQTTASQYVERALEFYRVQQGELAHPPTVLESSKIKCRGASKDIQSKIDPSEALTIATLAIMLKKIPSDSLQKQIFCEAQCVLNPLSETLRRISRLTNEEDHTSSRGEEFGCSPKVTFSASDASSFSPSKDRLPCSWENTWAHSVEFRNLLREMQTLVGECFPRPETARKESNSQRVSNCRIALAALLIAAISFRDTKSPLALKILPFSAKARVEAKYLGAALFDEIATQVSQLSTQSSPNLHASPNNLSSSTSRPAVSELRLRVSSMTASVARFHLRFIYDALPLQISKPGLAGPMDFSKCRSGLHNSIQLCSSGPRRMRQLCIPPQELKNSEVLSLYNGTTLCRNTVLAALPRSFDVDPSEVSLSTLVIRALRQLVSAARDFGGDSETEVSSKLSSASLSAALNLEEEARILGLDKDVIQLALAAEYARRFLCDISLVPGTENFATQSSKFVDQNVWGILSECAAAIKELVSGEDSFILLFTDGWDVYQERIRAPLISSSFIAECQTLFHDHLRQDMLDRQNEPKQSVAQSSEAPSEVELLDPCYFRLVNTDLIFDFPQVRLNLSD